MSLLGAYLAVACWWEDKTFRLEQKMGPEAPRWVYLLSEIDTYWLFVYLNRRQNRIDAAFYAKIRANDTADAGREQ